MEGRLEFREEWPGVHSERQTCRWTWVELADATSHLFDPVIKTLRCQEAKLLVGDSSENLISLEMFI